ncbi:MAG: amidohydrolase family protein [Planctomycetota bacterium]
MIIDAFALVGHWPLRPLRDERSPLRWMDRAGIDRALVLPLDAVFRFDALATSEEAVRLTRRSGGRLLPVYPVNPALPGWKERLDRAVRRALPAALALFPSYHLYGLDGPWADELLAEASRLTLPVHLALRLEDPRKQHPLFRARDVSMESALALARRHPDTSLVLLGASAGTRRTARRSSPGNVYVEISGMETLDPPAAAAKAFGIERVLFGTRGPFFAPESARLKLECSTLDARKKRLILFENARRLYRALS